jgi:uncharacterized phage protein (TIGR02220 family)
MGKRFTDTDKWDDEWFMELEPAMKCLWIYICDKCDCAGVWKVNFKKASYVIGGIFDKQSALNAFKGRVTEIGKEKWFIEKFIQFQYPRGLSAASSIHKGVLKSLENNNIPVKPYLSLIAPTERIKDKDMDKDKEIPVLDFKEELEAKKILPDVKPLENPKSEISVKVVTALNAILGRTYKVTPDIQKLIDERFSEGFRFEDFVAVIKLKQATWGGDPKTSAWLRPETLFGPKMNSYVQETKNPVKSISEGHRPVPKLTERQVQLLKEAGQI